MTETMRSRRIALAAIWLFIAAFLLTLSLMPAEPFLMSPPVSTSPPSPVITATTRAVEVTN
jgi:hypothetical protein